MTDKSILDSLNLEKLGQSKLSEKYGQLDIKSKNPFYIQIGTKKIITVDEDGVPRINPETTGDDLLKVIEPALQSAWQARLSQLLLTVINDETLLRVLVKEIQTQSLIDTLTAEDIEKFIKWFLEQVAYVIQARNNNTLFNL